jgi:AraC-like DNA-binding protein
MQIRSSRAVPSRWLEPAAQVLHELRLSQSQYCRTEMTAPWGLSIPSASESMFHYVAEGEAYLRGAANEPVRLVAGDFVLLPHGHGHALASTPKGRAVSMDSFAREQIGRSAHSIRGGGGGMRALIICGSVAFEDHGTHPLLRLLPQLLHLRGVRPKPLLRTMLEAMGAEARSAKLGATTIMTRIADVLVIYAVRAWFDDHERCDAGWLGALRDPAVGGALALMHGRPEEPWTVASLAAEVGMSRSSFAERFTSLTGVPPLLYLTRFRMHLSLRWLREDKTSIGAVAERLGYESEPAFSRAFKRHIGVSPGQARRGRRPTAMTRIDGLTVSPEKMT